MKEKIIEILKSYSDVHYLPEIERAVNVIGEHSFEDIAEAMPTEEAERDDAEDFLATKDIWNHPRITDRCDKESYEVADLMAEFATEWVRNRMGGEE